jgi:hypothetical protein
MSAAAPRRSCSHDDVMADLEIQWVAVAGIGYPGSDQERRRPPTCGLLEGDGGPVDIRGQPV